MKELGPFIKVSSFHICLFLFLYLFIWLSCWCLTNFITYTCLFVLQFCSKLFYYWQHYHFNKLHRYKLTYRLLSLGLVPTLVQIFPYAGLQFGFYAFFKALWEVAFVTKVCNHHTWVQDLQDSLYVIKCRFWITRLTST